MKILSFNIHKGFSASRRFSLPELRKAIHEVDADLVFLQEVIGEHRKHAKRISDWPEVHHCEYLAENAYPHRVYGLNAVNLHSNHGNAFLSKYPLLFWTNVDLSTNLFEQRGCLHALVSLPDTTNPLHCLCVHLNLLHRSRLTQVKTLCDRINSVIPSQAPFILAGDFNDWSESLSAIVEVETGAREIFHLLDGTHATSFPSLYPLLKLDRVYVRGMDPISAEVLRGKAWSRLSDHLPILAQVGLR